MSGINPARGEVGLMVGGVRRRLLLTLGALAEIEAALGAECLPSLAARMQRFSAADLRIVLGALLRGGGEAEAANRLDELEMDFAEAARAIAQAFERAFAA